MVRNETEIVVLGGNGFIGSAVLRATRAQTLPGRHVRTLVRRSMPLQGGIAQHIGSLENVEPRFFPERPFLLLHFATKQIDYDRSGFVSNEQGLTRLLGLLAETPHLRGMIYGSSASTIGNEHVEPQRLPALTASRLVCERLIEAFCAERNIPGLALRPRFVIGETDRFTLPGLVRLTRKRLSVGDGKQSMSIIDVDHYARLVVDLVDWMFCHPEAGVERLHMGYRRRMSLRELQAEIAASLGLPPPRWRLPAVREGNVSAVLSTFAPLRSLVGRLQLLSTHQDYPVDSLQSKAPSFDLDLDPRAVLHDMLFRWKRLNDSY